MAGSGRQYVVLERFFQRVEMLEQSEEMYKHHHPMVKTHKTRVQQFAWPEKYYDCITCVWNFCYLEEKDREDLLCNIDKALKEEGRVIIFEPVLRKDEIQEERPHRNTQ